MVRIETVDIKPICPHCENELDYLAEVQRGFWAINRVFCCPLCKKILGISAGVQ